MNVYEVEMEPIIAGQRFEQHVRAKNPDEARAKVTVAQGRKIIEVRFRRKCSQHEIDEARAGR